LGRETTLELSAASPMLAGRLIQRPSDGQPRRA
jgi:hypothetical protein